MRNHLDLLERLNNKHKIGNTKFQRLKELPCGGYSLPGSDRGHKTQHLPVLPVLFCLQNNTLDTPLQRNGQSCSQIEKFYHQVVIRDLILQNGVRRGVELTLAPKVVINTTSKRFAANRRELTIGLAAVLLVSGQRGEPTIARKSVAAFNLREGAPLGCKVTLRSKRGYSILDKLATFVLPRGYPSRVRGTVDEAGNWGVGISDPLLFVELEGQYDLFRSLEGIDVSIATGVGRRQVTPLLLSGLRLVV